MSQQSNENPFSNIKAPKIPDWVDTEHPDFPRYFSIAILDDKGNPVKWWERLPEASILHQNVEELETQNDNSVVKEGRPVVHIDMLPDGWVAIEVDVLNRQYFEVSTGSFSVIGFNEIILMARRIARIDFNLSEFWDSAGRVQRDYYGEGILRDFVLNLYRQGHIRNIDSNLVEEIIRTR